MELVSKYVRLREIIEEMGRVVVAFSGGVDSTFLLKVARDVLGHNAVGVMGLSETVPGGQLTEARKLIQIIGANFLTVNTEEFQQEEFVSNPKNRCFYCKSELFSKLWQVAKELEIDYVLDGCNADDTGDYRPGMEAGRALNVRSPLLEAGMTKDDIRAMSRQLGLPTWDRPASPCLSSRFPYGTRITREGLTKVDKAEQYLKSQGFLQVRARYHEQVLRLEVDRGDMPRLLELADRVLDFMRSIGFTYVTLDLAGYRMGSANELLKLEIPNKIIGGFNYGKAN